jgi:hypothetical protein
MVTYIKKWPVPHELLSRVAVAEAELEELVLSTLVAFFALFYLHSKRIDWAVGSVASPKGHGIWKDSPKLFY